MYIDLYMRETSRNTIKGLVERGLQNEIYTLPRFLSFFLSFFFNPPHPYR